MPAHCRPTFAATVLALLLTLTCAVIAHAGQPEPSAATADCLGCHGSLNPGIVEGWKKSRHAAMTPAMGLAVEGLGNKVSSKDVPEALRGASVGCFECHGLRADKHADAFEHNGYTISVVPSPEDCATCHRTEHEQFAENIMSRAYGNLADNQLYGQLRRAFNGPTSFVNGRIEIAAPSALTEAESCFSCHGTKVTVSGRQTRETALGEMEFPVLDGWPSAGVGRVNPDGSVGSCAACHARHEFSIATARSPETCKQCHVGPDVPVAKVYEASRHGKIYSAQGGEWDMEHVPWTIGKDFTAPTCAACHVSLTVDTDGAVVAQRSHRMNDRLPWRLFGLPYAHAHPISPDTTPIRNASGLALPTDLSGEPATKFLIAPAEQEKRAAAMQENCRRCHDDSWVAGSWKRLEHTIAASNAETRTATQVMQAIWDAGLAKGLKDKENPFDEHIERVWHRGWLFYGNTVRFASAMSCGGDYGVFANGRYQLTETAQELADWLREHAARKDK